MDWIKKHTDQFALGLLAFILVALSVLIVLRTQSFAEGFSTAMTTPPHSKEVPPLEMAPIESAQKRFAQPTQWAQKDKAGSLFVSLNLIVDEAGALKKADVGDLVSGLRKIPKAWLILHGLDNLSPAVLDEDPDKDGFTNYEEYIGPDLAETGEDSTDPKDKASHSPYYTKLFLERWIKIPFLVTFQSHDGDPKNPKGMTFAINAISRAVTTEFLELGQMVKNSKFKLEKFEEKKQKVNEVDEDVSELSIRNTESGEVVVLVLGKKTDSPDSYASFRYFWPDNSKPEKIEPKRLGQFALKPEVQQLYKLVDIKDDGAVIQLPGGEKTYNVPLLKRALELQKKSQ